MNEIFLNIYFNRNRPLSVKELPQAKIPDNMTSERMSFPDISVILVFCIKSEGYEDKEGELLIKREAFFCVNSFCCLQLLDMSSLQKHLTHYSTMSITSFSTPNIPFNQDLLFPR